LFSIQFKIQTLSLPSFIWFIDTFLNYSLSQELKIIFFWNRIFIKMIEMIKTKLTEFTKTK